MKILCAEYNEKGEHAIISIGDDVLLRNNDNFYIPEFTQKISCIPQIVIRLNRLGKNISERFASRYYEEIGVGVRFYADDYEQELSTKKLPVVAASSFCNSAAISSLRKIMDYPQIEYSMFVNDKQVFSANITDNPLSIVNLVTLASNFHTLKIGDFMFCGNMFRYKNLNADDRIRILLNNETMMDFEIK